MIVKITMKETITPCNALSLDLYFLFNYFQKPLKLPFFLKTCTRYTLQCMYILEKVRKDKGKQTNRN